MIRRSNGWTALMMVGVLACGGGDTGTSSPDAPSEITDTTPDLPPPDTGPVTDCTDLPAGTECDDGDPCTSGDACDGSHSCIAATTTVCEDLDHNPCTDPVCDPNEGDPAIGYCMEVPITDKTAEDVCHRYQCTDGEVASTEPSDQNDCAEWEVPTGGCIDHYVCDSQFESPEGSSHCRPVGKVDGTPCLTEGVGVKAAANAATADESSDCLLYVCHQQDAPNTALTTPQCVLSSSLPDDVQQSLEAADNKLRHVCGMDDSPETVNFGCNEWRCGCKDEICTEPECQVDPVNAKVGKPCGNGNLCDGSACMPAKGAGAVMECQGIPGSEVACDLFPDATCDVSGPCDPGTGCPIVMDVDLSNAKCVINNPCIDAFNTYCAPNDPNAHPDTGCVTNFKDPGTPCGQALKDACVLDATCEVDGESMKCQVNEWVTCNDGNPCTKDFCADGECQTTELPGECDDEDACTKNDLCQSGQCVGTPVSCNDGLDCTADSCNVVTGCSFVPNDAICDDGNPCTDNTCSPDGGCVVTNNTASCDDENACTTQDTCAAGACQGGPALVCDDGLFCDGQETCDTAKGCQNGPVPTITDGVGCTTDYCDEDQDQIVHTADNSACDNGQYCDGVETCDAAQGCLNGTAPKTDDGVGCTVDTCDEANDQMVHTPNDAACNNGQFCDGVEECDAKQGCVDGTLPSTDDGVDCTMDSCDEASDEVVHAPNDAACDNTLFCDGKETCHATKDCQKGSVPAITDLVGCTVDYCDEDKDQIVHTLDHSACDNGQYCDGTEKCDAVNGCVKGTPPNQSDDVDCTTDSCDENTDQIIHEPSNSFCANGQYCDGVEICDVAKGCVSGTAPKQSDGVDCTDDSCNDIIDQIVHAPNDAFCNNDLFCDGVESCDAQKGCVSGAAPTLSDNVICTADACDEANDQVLHTPDHAACNNGQYCDGVEACDAVKDCVNGTAPQQSDGVDCTDDSCNEIIDQIVHAPNDGFCDNGLFCDGAESCDVNDGCVSGDAPAVEDKVDCTVDSCDEGIDQVLHAPNDSVCDTGQLCVSDTCDVQAGCQSDTLPNCCGNNVVEGGAAWHAEHSYHPEYNPGITQNSQFLDLEIAATKINLPAEGLTATTVRLLAALGQSYTVRLYTDNGGTPGATIASATFTGTGVLQEVALVPTVCPKVLWVGLQGPVNGMTVFGDSDGQQTMNVIYGCTLYLPGFGCLGSWGWKAFAEFGFNFVGVGDLILSVGTAGGSGEQCDDGNTTTEICDYGVKQCTICDANCQSVAGATSYCGDGDTDETNGESCDDSNTDTEICGYGQEDCTVCDATCQSIEGTLIGFCGDGTIQNDYGELCDTNCPKECNDNNTCTTDSLTGTSENCNVVCISDPITACANGDGCCLATCNANTDNDCAAVCGNNIQEENETCDDGNTADGDGCSAGCQLENKCSSVHFAGTSSPAFIVDWESALDANYAGLTAEVWIRGQEPNNQGYVLSSYDTPGNGPIWASVLHEFEIPIDDGQWHHVATVFDSATSSRRYYVDGQEVQSQSKYQAGALYPATIGAAGFYVGGDNTSNAWIGDMQGLRVSKSAKYNGAFNPPLQYGEEPDTLLFVPFTNSSAGEITEEGPFGLDIQPIGASALGENGPFCPTPSVCGNDITELGETCDDGNTADGDGCSSACVETFQCPKDCDPLGTLVGETNLAKIVPDDGTVGMQFSYAVSLSDDTMAIGAHYDDGTFTNTGSVYVYKRTGEDWSLQQKLIAFDGAQDDVFGYSVSVWGDTLVTGAMWDDDVGLNKGSAYVYTRSEGVWTLQQKLTPDKAAPVDNVGYGKSVAIFGDSIVVGSYLDGSNGSGSAHVYSRSNGVWSLDQKLTASDGAQADNYGLSVTIYGNTVVVGSRDDDDKGSNSGSAYVYTGADGVWSLEKKLTADDGAQDDAFSISISLWEDTLVVGALQNADKEISGGSAYVYKRTGGVWNLAQKLVAFDAAQGDNYGCSVSASGDTLVVGADRDDYAGAEMGSAYVYSRSEGVWSLQKKLIADKGSGGDLFGSAVSASGDTLVVGAWHEQVNGGAASGSAYAYSAFTSLCTTPTTCQCKPGYDGPDCGNTTCGDSITAGNETCDDGNTADGDGCSASCTTEATGCANGSADVVWSETMHGCLGSWASGDYTIAKGNALCDAGWHVCTATDYCAEAKQGQDGIQGKWLGLHASAQGNPPVACDSYAKAYGAYVTNGDNEHGVCGCSQDGGNGYKTGGVSAYMNGVVCCQTEPTCTSLSFDGLDDVADCGSTLGALGDKPVTILFRVKLGTKGNDSPGLISKGAYSNGEAQWYVRFTGPEGTGDGGPDSNNYVHFLIIDAAGTNQDITSKSAIELGSWHNVAVQRHDSGMRIYIDGVLDKETISAPVNCNPSGSVKLGMYPTWWAPPGMQFDGQIDELLFYSRELSGSEIQEKMASPVIPSEEIGLATQWSFNEASGDTVADLSGNTNHCTLQGATWVADCPASSPGAVCGDGTQASWEQCDDNNTDDGDGCSATCEVQCTSIRLKGNTASYGNVQTASHLDVNYLEGRTIEGWIKLGSDAASIVERRGYDGLGDHWWELRYDNGVLRFEFHDGLELPSQKVVGAIAQDEWFHFAVVRGQKLNGMRLYINGKQADSVIGTGVDDLVSSTISPNHPLMVGKWLGDDTFWVGPTTYYQLRFSSSIRYTENFAPGFGWLTDADTLGLYDFSITNENTVADSSAYAKSIDLFDVETATDSPICTPGAVCGDGTQASWEQCDDGNTAAGDGCDDNCQLQSQGIDCADIHFKNPDWPDGAYTIDPPGSSPYTVYCDMTTAGGGWTYVARGATSQTQTNEGVGAVQTSPNASIQWHLSTEQITQITQGTSGYESYVTMGVGGDEKPEDAGWYRVRLESGPVSFEDKMWDYKAWNGQSWTQSTQECAGSDRGPCWQPDDANYCCKRAVDGAWESCQKAPQNQEGQFSSSDGFGPNGEPNQHLRCGADTTLHNGLIIYVRRAICGNGQVEGNETCDDGNAANGDGCSTDCQVELEPLSPGVIVAWAGSSLDIPTGWALCDGTNGTPNLTHRFLMGTPPVEKAGATGGDTPHDHGGATSTTSLSTASADPPGRSCGGNSCTWKTHNHIHNHDFTHSHNGIPNDQPLPPYYEVAYLMNLSSSFAPGGSILASVDTPDPESSDWRLCDGTNGTPDLRGRFLRGLGPDSLPGTTGGSPTHAHGGSSAEFDQTGKGPGNWVTVGCHGASATDGNHRHKYPHSHAINDATNLPPYTRLNFLRVPVDATIPQGAIAMWSGLQGELPSGWSLCDGSNACPNLSERFIRGAQAGEIIGTQGGSANHIHSLSDNPGGSTNTNGGGNGSCSDGGSYMAFHSHTLPSHGHSLDTAESHLPPWYKIVFMIKE